MSTIAFDQFALTRIADFARQLSRLHQVSRRQAIDDDQIDREFNAVCMSVWGYTTDDISDDLFSIEDHTFLDSLDEAHARIFAAEAASLLPKVECETSATLGTSPKRRISLAASAVISVTCSGVGSSFTYVSQTKSVRRGIINRFIA